MQRDIGMPASNDPFNGGSLLKVSQVALALNYSPQTVYLLIKEGKLTGTRLANGSWRVKAEDLRKFTGDEPVSA